MSVLRRASCKTFARVREEALNIKRTIAPTLQGRAGAQFWVSGPLTTTSDDRGTDTNLNKKGQTQTKTKRECVHVRTFACSNRAVSHLQSSLMPISVGATSTRTHPLCRSLFSPTLFGALFGAMRDPITCHGVWQHRLAVTHLATRASGPCQTRPNRGGNFPPADCGRALRRRESEREREREGGREGGRGGGKRQRMRHLAGEQEDRHHIKAQELVVNAHAQAQGGVNHLEQNVGRYHGPHYAHNRAIQLQPQLPPIPLQHTYGQRTQYAARSQDAGVFLWRAAKQRPRACTATQTHPPFVPVPWVKTF